jgi:replicative DNA helicase
VSNEIAEMAYGMPDDVTKAVDDAEARMFDVAQRRVTNTTAAIRDLLPANLDRIEMLYDRGESITGLSTGYIDLDEKLAGLQPSALYVVGARPAMGKTAFALGMAANSAMKDGRPVLIFTLEMSQLELCQRLLCAEALVDAGRVKTGRLEEGEWNRISHAVGRLAEAPIYIDDNPHTSVMDIRAKARRLKSRQGDLGMVVVDYIQLMTGRSSAESRQVEVSEISRNLKILARELEAPVVALAQLNRALEQRQDKRPMLSDLRESGSLEQDADVVLFLYRDEVYDPDSPDKGVAEVIVAKHRNGPTGRTRLAFRGQYTRFDNMARSSRNGPRPDRGAEGGVEEF